MFKKMIDLFWSAYKGSLYFALGADRFAFLQGWHWSRKLQKESYDAAVFVDLAHVLAPGATCLDIGANVGQYSVNLSRIVGASGHVWAFEPVPYTRAILRAVLTRFSITNVTVMSEALSDSAVSTVMVTPCDIWGVPQVGLSYIGGSADTDNAHSQAIEMRPLDVLMRDAFDVFGFGGFVKIDVEGHEFYVLRGAQDFLSRWKPVLLIELDPEMSRRAGVDVSDTLQLLADLGYEMGSFNAGVWLKSLTEVVSGGQMYWFRHPL